MTARSIRFVPYSDGQGGMIETLEGETVIGWLYYSLYGDGTACVDVVEVVTPYQRQDVARRMVELLVARHPGVSIYRAAANEASGAFFASVASARPHVTFDVN